MSDFTAIAIAIALLLGNAFFVGAEFALISARRTQIEPRAAAGSRSARLTIRGMEHVSMMMAGAQLGITMCSLGLGAIAEPAIAHLLEVPLEAIGVSGAWLHGVAFTIALALVVFLHMVLGEMVPKNLAIAGPERTALILGPPLYLIVTVLKPVIWLLNAIANVVLRVLRVTPQDEVASTFDADEVGGLIAQSRAEGLLDEAEHRVLSGSLTLGFETVRDVMVTREDLVTLPVGATPQQAQRLCVKTGFSRFPLEDKDGTLVGYVHLKDFVSVPRGGATKSLPADAVRPLVTISADERLDSALSSMQAQGTHIALVTDGDQIVGAAMLEDVVERLVGEVVDAGQAIAS
ncbi:hemolysin family protein [Demequina aurantiaca]|uniref:hemolysin family protein n=1 Tax=Demequina aurantiaca TaxID=676200 RepID=UPI0007848ED8|nr:hemolysin family protein [Demequina aurantiaca]